MLLAEVVVAGVLLGIVGDHRIQLVAGFVLHDMPAAFAAPHTIFGAGANHQAAFGGEAVVDHANRSFRILALVGHNEVTGVAVHKLLAGPDLLGEGFAGQHGQHIIALGIILHVGVRSSIITNAHEVITDVGAVFFSRQDEHVGIQQLFFVELLHVLQIFLVLLGSRNEHILIVHDVILSAGNAQSRQNGALKDGVASGVGYRLFIGGIAVAVSVLISEGNQHVVQIVQRFGSFQTQILQPLNVVIADGSNAIAGGGVDDGHAVDGAVLIGDGRADFGILLHESGEVGGVLFDQLGQINEDALSAVHGFVFSGDTLEEDIRVVAGSYGQRLALIEGAAFNQFKLQVDAQLFTEGANQVHIGEVRGLAGAAREHDGEGDLLIYNGVAFSVEAVIFGHGEGRQQHEACQQQS